MCQQKWYQHSFPFHIEVSFQQFQVLHVTRLAYVVCAMSYSSWKISRAVQVEYVSTYDVVYPRVFVFVRAQNKDQYFNSRFVVQAGLVWSRETYYINQCTEEISIPSYDVSYQTVMRYVCSGINSKFRQGSTFSKKIKALQGDGPIIGLTGRHKNSCA